MSESLPTQSTPSGPAPSPQETDGRVRRVGLITLGVLVLAVFAFWFAVSVLPRWWSHQVGSQVDGDLTTGGILGFMYGFLATLLPLLVLGLVFRYWRRSAWAWVIGIGIALLLAAPNLITLGIVLGNGGAAHAAERTLDVEAPWFRGGMVLGVVSAVLLALFVGLTMHSRRRAQRRADEADARLEAEPKPRQSVSRG